MPNAARNLMNTDPTRKADQFADWVCAPHLIAFACAGIPACALLFTFIISSHQGNIEACVPFIHGCTSISKAARNGYSLYLFRMLIVPSAMLQLLFWIILTKQMVFSGIRNRRAILCLLITGCTSAMFLIVYANFLGTEGTVYKFMRRLGIYVYFAATVIAQLQLTYLSFKIRRQSPSKMWVYRTMTASASVMLVLALFQAYIKLFVANHDAYENVIEWNIAVAMHVPFLVYAWLWREERPTFVMGSCAR